MSVLNSYLMAGETSLDLDEFGRATVVKKFLIITSNGKGNPALQYNGSNPGPDNEYTVAIQSVSAGPDPVPQLLTQYNLDHGAGEITGTTDTCSWLTKKRVVRVLNDESDWSRWYITCTWTPLPYGFAGGLGTGGGPVLPSLTTPLSDPIIERSEYEHYRRKAEYDINGSAIINSAGDPLHAEVDDIRPVLVFIKNMATAASIDALAAAYKNAINTDTFRGHAPYTLKIASITKGLLQERRPLGGAAVPYMPMIVRIHKAEVSVGSLGTDETWRLNLADRGHQVYENAGTGTGATRIKNLAKVLYPISPTSGIITSWLGDYLDSVNLASDGTRLPDGQEPRQKTFKVYPEMPFSGLGLT